MIFLCRLVNRRHLIIYNYIYNYTNIALDGTHLFWYNSIGSMRGNSSYAPALRNTMRIVRNVNNKQFKKEMV